VIVFVVPALAVPSDMDIAPNVRNRLPALVATLCVAAVSTVSHTNLSLRCQRRQKPAVAIALTVA